MNIIIFAAFILLSVSSLTGCKDPSVYSTYVLDESVSNTDDEEISENESPEVSVIFVDIEGAVVLPGVYELPSDSRVDNLITAAGGLRDDASTDDLNRARPLTDGEKIVVLTQNEAKKKQDESFNDEEEDSLIDINTADEAGLTSLPGIGESKARAIITYREENGLFSSTDDIMNVSGIGEATYANIKDLIKVSGSQ